jgi:energy-coupling factor transport system ATP-binding protein
VLELRNVSFAYQEGPRVVRDVSLEVPRGARLAVMGENGSGKTTLAHLMCGLLKPPAGKVLVDGLSTGDPGSIHEIRRRVGIVFQDPDDQLIETTVEREVGFGLRNLGLSPSDVGKRVDGALAVFGIEHLRRRSCHLLSAGEKQTVTVASIFAMEPDYVLLDEATSLLDAESRLHLVATIERLLTETGAGLVFVSMRLEDVWMCDRVVFLRQGFIAFDGGKADAAAWLAEQGFHLSGLSHLVSRLGREIPGFGSRISSCRSLTADAICGILAEVAGGSGGDAVCP